MMSIVAQLVLKLFWLRDVGKKEVKGHIANTTTVGDVCVQYERNPTRGFKDLFWKRNCSPLSYFGSEM